MCKGRQTKILSSKILENPYIGLTRVPHRRASHDGKLSGFSMKFRGFQV